MVNQWEYMLLAGKGLDEERLVDKLNELGAEGWEVVAHVGYETLDSMFSSARGWLETKRRCPRGELAPRFASTEGFKPGGSGNARSARWVVFDGVEGSYVPLRLSPDPSAAESSFGLPVL